MRSAMVPTGFSPAHDSLPDREFFCRLANPEFSAAFGCGRTGILPPIEIHTFNRQKDIWRNGT